MKDIALEFKNLFSSRGYDVGRVSVYVNIDGRCQGLNMMVVQSQDDKVLNQIRKDLSFSGMFFDMSIKQEIDWSSVTCDQHGFEHLDDNMPMTNILTVYMKEV